VMPGTVYQLLRMIESALIMHKGVAETTVIDTADELMGQAIFAFVTLKLSVFLSVC